MECIENGDTRTPSNLQVLQSKLNHPRQQLSLKSFHKQTFRSHSHEGSQIHSRWNWACQLSYHKRISAGCSWCRLKSPSGMLLRFRSKAYQKLSAFQSKILWIHRWYPDTKKADWHWSLWFMQLSLQIHWGA